MDALAIVLVLLAVAAFAAALTRSLRKARPPSTEDDPGVPTFRVVALGPRGSGKTMLLASMYHQMQTPSGRGYFLNAPYDQVVLLNNWFTEVADTHRDWPSGTVVADLREFLFTVRARGTSGNLHTILRLGYLDYAGGLLIDQQAPGSTAQDDLLDRIRKADALLGVIDGYRIRQCLDGDAEGRMRLQQTITSMINLMIDATSPITFVITKWDLLQDIDADENGRLHLVRKLLMSNQGFRDLVELHSARRVVRLIPVSAVGPEFATLTEDGVIEKLPDGHLHPTNVDVPLSAVVPDVFGQVERLMNRQKLEDALDSVRRQAGMGAGQALAELGAFVLQTTGRAFGAVGSFGASFLGDAAMTLFDRRADSRSRLEQQLSDVDRQIEEYHLTRRRVLRELQSRVDILEGRLPASRLSHED